MKEALEHNDTEAMLAAVRLNWRLWTIFQGELLDPVCTVPDDIRTNVLSLAQFVDKHTVAFIAEPEPAKLDVLISINRDLAGGLHEGFVNGQQKASENRAAEGPSPVIGPQAPTPRPEGTEEVARLKISV